MPFGNGTGPWGTGPGTGRGLGDCAGVPAPGYVNPYGWGGRGWGRGRGCGRGMAWRHGRAGFGRGMTPPWPPDPAVRPAREDELRALQDQASHLESVLDEMRRRMDELQGEESNE